MPLKMSFQIWESEGLWYWHLKAENQEIIAEGGGYTSKEVCVHAINLVKNSDSAPIEK
jgi:uncharacterized protein YegP (UPF0339 family)